MRKIAIQLFGHLRTFRETHQSFYNNLISKMGMKSTYSYTLGMRLIIPQSLGTMMLEKVPKSNSHLMILS